MRNKIIIFLLLCISLIFSGCFSSWQEETGTIILNLGSNSRNVGGFPPNEQEEKKIEYKITFTGANDEFTLDSVGSQPVKTTVASGEWKITVEAFENVSNSNGPIGSPEKIMYAIGKETVKVKPGKPNPVTVKMSNMATVELNIDISVIENSFSEYNDIHDFISFSIYGFSSPRNPSKEADAEIPSFPTPITGPHIIPIESGKWNFYVNVFVCGNPYTFQPFNDINISPGSYKKIYFDFEGCEFPDLYSIVIEETSQGTAKVRYKGIDSDEWYTKAYVKEGSMIEIEAIPAYGYKTDWNKWKVNNMNDIIITSDQTGALEFPYFIIGEQNVTITPVFAEEE